MFVPTHGCTSLLTPAQLSFPLICGGYAEHIKILLTSSITARSILCSLSSINFSCCLISYGPQSAEEQEGPVSRLPPLLDITPESLRQLYTGKGISIRSTANLLTHHTVRCSASLLRILGSSHRTRSSQAWPSGLDQQNLSQSPACLHLWRSCTVSILPLAPGPMTLGLLLVGCPLPSSERPPLGLPCPSARPRPRPRPLCPPLPCGLGPPGGFNVIGPGGGRVIGACTRDGSGSECQVPVMGCTLYPLTYTSTLRRCPL